MRTVFNALRWLVRTGCLRRMMPQTRHWVGARWCKAMTHGLHAELRAGGGEKRRAHRRHVGQPHPPVHAESGARTGFDGAKKRKGSKLPAAVDMLGHLLAPELTAAGEQDRASRSFGADVASGDQRKRRTGVHHTAETPAPVAQRRGCGWTWSDTTGPGTGLCCRHAVGWWNAPSPGPRVSGGWPVITKGLLTPWPPTAGRRSSPSGSVLSLLEVHDRL